MDHKYEMLVKVLDQVLNEAPLIFKSYYPNPENNDEVIHARSLAFIHLLLKVKFGIAGFLPRHKFITDGTQDGGIDAYYIDKDKKKIFFIQSKFRSTAQNFENKSIDANELIRMEINRVIHGDIDDSNGKKFNDKILAFQKELSNIRDIARYDFLVIFLGNISHLNDTQIRKLIDNSPYEIYDAQVAYKKLVFPLATGMLYDPDEIIISLELIRKESFLLKQEIETDFGKYSVAAIFAPTIEIGRVMSKYKNSLLKYNPRNFLSLQKKSVNEKIRSSILDQRKNNFAVLNNGITLLSENVMISDSTGRQNEGQLIITKPQILNGGQTAFTLSEIYEEYVTRSNNPLVGKEVLLKIITPVSHTDTSVVDAEFIRLISNATNQQNEVNEADRRSNDKTQIFLQEKIFSDYGYFYERKAGEFHDGIKQGYIEKRRIINRLDFIKAYEAFLGEPAAARRTSDEVLFRESNFNQILNDLTKYPEMFFAYLLFSELGEIQNRYKPKTDSISKYGYSLLYGKWAVVASIGITKPQIINNFSDMLDQAKLLINNRLSQWTKFDDFVKNKRKGTKYFSKDIQNFELYYKIHLLDDDVKEFFRS